MFLYTSFPHSYCAFLPDQQYHPHKHCITSKALFLKALFSHVRCSEILILPHTISRMTVFEENMVIATGYVKTFMNQTSME
jgi:predicted nucleic acid-binding Zn ribbon protein